MDSELREKFFKLRSEYKKVRYQNTILEDNPIVLQLRWCNVNTQLAVFSGRHNINGYAAIGASTSIQNIIDARGNDIEELSGDMVGFKYYLISGLMEKPELFPPLFRKTIRFLNDDVSINRLLYKFPLEFLDVIFSNPPAIKATETTILSCSKRHDLPYIPYELWYYMFVNFIV
jgi:hypothetical protein